MWCNSVASRLMIAAGGQLCQLSCMWPGLLVGSTHNTGGRSGSRNVAVAGLLQPAADGSQHLPERGNGLVLHDLQRSRGRCSSSPACTWGRQQGKLLGLGEGCVIGGKRVGLMLEMFCSAALHDASYAAAPVLCCCVVPWCAAATTGPCRGAW